MMGQPGSIDIANDFAKLKIGHRFLDLGTQPQEDSIQQRLVSLHLAPRILLAYAVYYCLLSGLECYVNSKFYSRSDLNKDGLFQNSVNSDRCFGERGSAAFH